MNKRKLLWGVGVLASVLIVLPLFAAFEAHVINVTATIENALSVPTEREGIDFGTVFPQEEVNQTFDIFLSESFLLEDRVDDVNYEIRQKPKCGLPIESTDPVQYSEFGRVIEDGGEFVCEDQRFVILPNLCPYLSKHEVTDDGEETDNDEGVDAFHGLPGTWNLATTLANRAFGRLAKSAPDESDTWNIDFKVPCFSGQCAQDWDEFVLRHNSQAIPDDYVLPQNLEHELFGCDLWIEVNDVSETPRPTVGANLTAYVQSSSCDVTVDDSGGADFTSIQAGVDAATQGQTVCVAEGTYDEDVVIDKEITLSGDGANNTSVINGQAGGQSAAVRIAADNVTLEGFEINGAGIAAIYIAGARDNITVQSNKATAATGKNAFVTEGGQTNHTISNNVFEGNASQLTYVNGLASVNVASDNVDFTNNTFGGSANLALGQEASNSSITQNKFSTVTSFTDVEDWGDGNNYNQNNFNDGGLNLQHSENGNTGVNGITDAENNWWGDTDPSDGDVNANVDVDFDPFEASAFPEN